MKRTAVLWFFALLALVCAFSGFRIGDGGSAVAAMPTPTPTPVAIAYDEINRVAFGQITPPPVGAFHEDYERIVASIQSGDSATPPPRPHGLGGMVAKAMGMPGGPGAMMNPMSMMQNGTLQRYTFYWVKGWIRVDDPVMHMATIYKCREHQTIHLDLAHKTYTIETNDATPPPASFMPHGNGGGSPQMQRQMEPGTADMNVATTATALGAKTVEAIATQGYDSTNSLDMSNATGSCRNGSFSTHTVEYVSNINEQGNYCPASAAPGGGGGRAEAYGVVGGCRPTIKATHKGSVSPPAGKIAMYRSASFDAGEGRGATTVLERGNVTWYYNPDIPKLFDIPSDFTQQG